MIIDWVLRQQSKRLTSEEYNLGQIAAKEITAINALFAQHNVAAEIDPHSVIASDTGDFIRYRIVGISKISKIKALEEDLSVLISDLRNDEIRVKIRTPKLMIELPYPLETRNLEWADAPLRKLKPLQMYLGTDYTSANVKPAILDYSKESTANALFTGTTGSGKTSELLTALISMAYGTSPAQALYILIDSKRDRKFSAMAGLPHALLFNDPMQCVSAIASVRAELRRRQQTTNPDSRKIFLIVEEYSSLQNSLDDKAVLAQLEQDLLAIAEIGREKNIHVIACTQKAVVDVVGSVFKGNLPIRICGKVNTSEESKVGTGLDSIGAERLPECGSYYYINGGAVALVRGCYMSDEDRLTAIDEINSMYAGVDPFRIELLATDNPQAPAKVSYDMPLNWYVGKVIDHERFTDAFPPSGKPSKRAKGIIVEIIFGAGTPNAGRESEVGRRVYEAILNTQSSSTTPVENSSTENSTQ